MLYKTNYVDWQVLVSNLISTNNYSFNLTGSALGLMTGEVVTDVKLEFGTVEAGFTSVTKPMLTVLTLATLPSGYQITNRCEVGGRYQMPAGQSKNIDITKTISGFLIVQMQGFCRYHCKSLALEPGNALHCPVQAGMLTMEMKRKPHGFRGKWELYPHFPKCVSQNAFVQLTLSRSMAGRPGSLDHQGRSIHARPGQAAAAHHRILILKQENSPEIGAVLLFVKGGKVL